MLRSFCSARHQWPTFLFPKVSYIHFHSLHGLKGCSLIRGTNGANVRTYCILCLSRGRAGQSSPPRNSGWQPSTWSHCCHILCIQSGNRSANNHRNKPSLEPVFMGQLCFLHHPQPGCQPDSKLSSLLGSHSYPLPCTPSRALCFVLFYQKLSGQAVSRH